MRVVVLLGTMKGTSSYEYQVIEELLKLPFWKGVYVEVITPEEVVEHCDECGLCFKNGTCPYDAIDSMGKVKERILDSDLIIAASPSYLEQVSGVMKDWIDRMQCWTKILKLAGRGLIVVSSSMDSGTEYAITYLKKAFTYFGCYLVGELVLLKDKKDYTKDFTAIIHRLIQIYNRPRSVLATTYQNEIFLRMKELYEDEMEGLEAQEYMENEMFQFEFGSEYLVDCIKSHLLLV